MSLVNLTYPLARNGIFRTIQGEGAMLGVPMVFVRLAGCSVGCPECDTDYRVSERLQATQIRERVEVVRGKAQWIWITGGEPADHDLWPLLEELRLCGCGHIALATSGHKALGAAGRLVDFLSISPHGKPKDLIIRRGSQLNLVPELNGLRLSDWEWNNFPHTEAQFQHAYVTPCDGKPETMQECLEFMDRTPHGRYRLGVQAHKQWGLP